MFPSYDQEEERSQHRQELEKLLESLEREKTELEARLRKQQAEMEAMRTRREEERAEAESALCQVGSWEGCVFPVTPCLRPLPSSPPGVGLQGLPGLPLCPREQATGTVGCGSGRVSHFLREGRRLPHPVSLQTSGNLHTSWFSVSGPNLPLPSAAAAPPNPICQKNLEHLACPCGFVDEHDDP